MAKGEFIEKQVIKIIKEISQSDVKDEDFVGMNYLDKGLIDSLQVVEMIDNLEKQFKIHFSPDDLQSEKFRTIGGLIEMVRGMIRGKERVKNKSDEK